MTPVRWCPIHQLVLEEHWEGSSCPAGHDWFTQQRMGSEFWVVDIDLPPDAERFQLYSVTDGRMEPAPWYNDLYPPEETAHPEYLEQPNHWAKRKRQKGRDRTFMERAVFNGRV